jgi:uncharacterized membrane protein YuzA (DUF378 family)
MLMLLATATEPEGGIVFLVVGIAMVVFAWPMARWGLGVYFGRDIRAGKLRRDDPRFKKATIVVTIVYVIVGAVGVYIGTHWAQTGG